MKRFTLLLLVLCLLLCACGRKSAESTETTADATQASADATQATTEATKQETTSSTTEPEPQTYRHPLNGTLLEEPWTERPVAVVINNYESALPQHGISQADFLYEIETEGGITRRLGIFSNIRDVEKVGSIRSARTYFLNVATSYNAPLVHCGGSNYALDAQYDNKGGTLSNWEHIDEQTNWTYFFRDKDRQNSGYAFEHTLFTTGESIMNAMEARGYSTEMEDGVDYGLLFAEEPEMKGEKAEEVTICFRGSKKTTATYNKSTGLYEISQYKGVGVDGNDDTTLATRNVLVIYAKQTKEGILSFYNLIGVGEGLFACDGKIVPILWSRDEVTEPFVYTLMDGTPITLGVGNTFVGVVADTSPASYGKAD